MKSISIITSWIRLAVLAVFAALAGRLLAQTVSISPQTGNVISAASYSGESHLSGFGGVWVHNQLPMTLISSDKSGLTDNGLMSEHANNILASGNNLVFASGEGLSVINHMSLSLPKGYRFTSYKIVMDYDTEGSQASTFKEMDASFSTKYESVVVSSGSKGKVLQRTSMSDTDMGNILYFRQEHSAGMARVKVTSFVITFECTDPFTEVLTPGVSATYGTDCVALPFATQRVDLGPITKQTASSGYTSYKYTYTNVKDLHANFMLYDNSGITAGTATEGQVGDGHIVSASTQGSKTYMGLANDTYWLEVPTDALSQDGTTLIPVGYRIVGARLHCAASISSYAAPALGQDIYIMDNDGRYLNASLNYTATPVAWSTDTDGRVWTTSGRTTYYLTHDKKWNDKSTRTSDLKTTTKQSDAREYKLDARGLYWNTDYVGYSTTGTGTYSGTSATITGTTTVAGEASAYTVKLYDKTGNTIAATATVNESNSTEEISIDGLNNDAVKFAVEGLADGKTAHVSLEVVLEALNPYIDKMDVVCRQEDGSTSLSNQYLADDFTIGSDGKIEFAVPTNFAADKMRFTFDELHSKSADNTYGPLSESGNARYHFAKSAYYDLIGENLQAHRTEAADYDYTTKVSVAVAGNKAFRCNNSDNYSAGTSGSSTFVYEEYRYANDTYASQGGTWSAVELASGDSRDCYLVTSDETRYNIAPTTTPRHAYYAYYNTNITLKTENYKPELTYTTVYNNATLSSGLDSKKWVGVSVALRNTTTDALLDKGEGYAYAKQIIDQINTDIANGKTGAPTDAKHILYLDASGINSVLYSADDATLGTIDDIRDALATNAMIYLPQGVSYKANNVASLSISGDDYVAENDIVLTDQQPFFAPFDIRVNAANEVRYTRQVTRNHTTAQWLSLALPFTVAVDANGQYANDDDQCAFTFYKMNENNALDNMTMANSYDYQVDGHFSPFTSATATEANTPYLVGIDQAQPDDDASSKMVFTVRQKGSTIVKTPVTADSPLLTGETASATVGGTAATLTAHASFCGVTVPKTDGIFYFNKSLFASSLNLDDRYSDIYVMPFRGYYTVEGLNTAVRYIAISLEPGSEATGIDDATSPTSDLVLTAGDGTLTLTAAHDMQATVRTVGGQTVVSTGMKAGESRTVSLPAGIYIAGGQKVLVR